MPDKKTKKNHFTIKLSKTKELEIEYVILLLIIGAIIGILINHFVANLGFFRESKGYFETNENTKIEKWMTPRTILRNFDISEETLLKELNITKDQKSMIMPLENTCRFKKINCDDLVEKLNSLVISMG
jgi:hypothetical protein